MRNRSKIRGFTLLELMVVVAIAAILMALALPSFQYTLRSNRIATTTNQFTAAINMARGEAIKNTLGAAICPSANGTACGVDWDAGWLVWVDKNRNGLLDVGENVLNFYANSPQVALTVGVGVLQFDARGAPLAAAGDMFLASVPCPAGTPLRRTVTMTPTGQIRMAKGNCP
jgi:type IV fimbrial biogenesis protein FimT